MIPRTDDAEAELVVRAQAGDHRAFALLVGRYQDQVFRFVLRMSGIREEAMDLTQDTFLKAYRALPAWRPEARLRTWLFQIAHNATLDVLRRRQRVEFVPFAEGEQEGAILAAIDPGPTPEQALADRQRIGMLERALRDLPAEQREVLLLREVEDMSYAEIAATLGIGEGTVKSRLARARVAALAHYRDHAGENRDE